MPDPSFRLTPSAESLLIRTFRALSRDATSYPIKDEEDETAFQALDDLGLATPDVCPALSLTDEGKAKAARLIKASDDAYDRRERAAFTAREARINRSPLRERKEAQADYREACLDPTHMEAMADHLFAGDMGWIEQRMAQEILTASPRMNKVASLGQLLAVVNWGCPRHMARDAWKSLTRAQQKAVDAALARVLADAEKGLEEGGR